MFHLLFCNKWADEDPDGTNIELIGGDALGKWVNLICPFRKAVCRYGKKTVQRTDFRRNATRGPRFSDQTFYDSFTHQ